MLGTLVLLSVTHAVALAQPMKTAPGQIEDVEFLRAYAETRKFLSGRPTGAVPTPDGEAVLFLRGKPRSPVQTLFSFDVATGKTVELLTPEAVLAGADQTLSVEEAARLERQRISARGFTSFQLSKDGKRIVVGLSGKLYVVERAGGKVLPVHGAVGAIDPQLSPDGRHLAYVRDNDVFAVDLRTHRERRITRGGTDERPHGLAEFVAQEEMSRYSGYWWSPDGQWLAYQETDLTPVAQWTIADPMHPQKPANTFRYPAAGQANATVKLGVTSAKGGGKTTWIRWDATTYPYLATVVWPEKGPLSILVQNREQTEQVLLAVDPKTGATRPLLVERDEAWVQLNQSRTSAGQVFPRWLADGTGFFWYTERNGGPEVELRAADGSPRGTWIRPTDGYRQLTGYDEAQRSLYFLGSPDPTESVLHRVRENGAAERLAWGAGGTPAIQSAARLSANGEALVVTSTTDAAMQATRVFRADGTEAGVLPSVAEEPTLEVRAEYRVVGERKFRTVLFRPKGARPGAKVPVIVEVYGGPTSTVVNHSLGSHLVSQWMANQGFLVVKIDGRGTPHRGRAWHRAVLGDFATVTIADQVEALQALAGEVPELDLTRVGMTGWSFGGFMAGLAVLRRGDVFKAAVAGAPVADWKDYDTHYTERYLKLPTTNPDGYRASNLLTYADKLERPLLLIHGTADDNVYFLHSLKLSDALFRAGKPHELLPLSGLTHMVPDPVVVQREHEAIVGFFRRHL